MHGDLTMDGTANIAVDVRQRIEDLIADYAHMIDDDRLEEWPDYFVEDCYYRMIDRHSYAKGFSIGIMECSSRGMLQDRILALREANVFEPHCYRHLLSGTRITGEKDGVYTVVTSYTVIRTMQEGDMAVFSAGKYVDEVLFEGGAPKFRSRLVICDSNRVHTLIVIPI